MTLVLSLTSSLWATADDRSLVIALPLDQQVPGIKGRPSVGLEDQAPGLINVALVTDMEKGL